MSFSLLGGTCVPVILDSRPYLVQEWEPGLDFPFVDRPMLAMDTETEPIVKGAPVVPVVMQIAGSDCSDVVFVKPEHFGQALDEADRLNPTCQWGLFNAPFDCKVTGWPDNILWKALGENRLTCMQIRGTLHAVRDGTYQNKVGLDSLSKKLLKWTLMKDKSVTLSFEPNKELTPTQISYGAQDPVATLRCMEVLSEVLPTEDISLRGYFALSYISDLGFTQDEERRKTLDAELFEQQKYYFNMLQIMGVAPAAPEEGESTQKGPGGQRDRVQALLESLETAYDIKLPHTINKGKVGPRISMSQKTLDIALIAEQVPVPLWLQAHREFTHAQKMRTTYLREGFVGEDGRVHPYFNPMLVTGRTSCSKPNIQNMTRKGGIRGIYIPAEGYLLLDSDYNQLELCTLSQSCWNRFGESRMREIINEGGDIHYWFGDIIAKHDGKASEIDFTSKDDKLRNNYRQMAKACDFGFPGGLGAATFVAFARGYSVDLKLDKAKELKQLWLDAFPEMKKHLKPVVDDLWTARNIQRWLAAQKITGNSIRTLFDLEDFLRDRGIDDADIFRVTSKLAAYTSTIITGRTKSNCTFCAASNIAFQAPAADGAKIALWGGYCRSWRMVNFVHDSIMQEVSKSKSPEEITAFVDEEVDPLMIESMRRVTPDVAIRVESAIMDRWYKEAKPLRDSNNNLVMWTPETAKLFKELAAKRKEAASAA